MSGVFGRYFKGDRVIWTVVIILSAMSLLAVYSSTGSLAYRFHGGSTTYFLIKQLIFLGLGLSIVFITHLISYKVYYPLSTILLGISVPLLLITLVFGATLNQASRWLEVPGLGITFQTSDVAKLALIMYVSKILSQKQKDIKDLRQGFVPLVIPIGLICMLILPANFSTAA
ncbi:MAG TPA: FtsW/RodA/SpoVE family cell cycle protein, partial [Tenuifilaceae bacterium]|nr:FtsW/RodA/SpoVE family cell cycle protein [Tenuifilaceae bacterium]